MVDKGAKNMGANRRMQNERSVSVMAKMVMFVGIVVPLVVYGCKAWVQDKKEWRRLVA